MSRIAAARSSHATFAAAAAAVGRRALTAGALALALALGFLAAGAGCDAKPIPAPGAGAGANAAASPAERVARGRFLVGIGGCHDCHTPMTFDAELGMPMHDMTRALSGHPEGAPDPASTLAGHD